MATKIFIVDDHYLVVEGIRSLLWQVPGVEWMGHAMNAASCLAFLQQQQPDVILMDINLPDQNGMDLCLEVKRRYPSVFVLGLSTFNQRSYVEKMMENGASGYLLKNATQEEILLAIKEVMAGRTYLSHEAAGALRKQDELETPVLTRREKEVLVHIADGLTNNEIASKLFLSVNTVDTHRKNLFTKFSAKNIAELVKLAVRAGLVA